MKRILEENLAGAFRVRVAHEPWQDLGGAGKQGLDLAQLILQFLLDRHPQLRPFANKDSEGQRSSTSIKSIMVRPFPNVRQ